MIAVGRQRTGRGRRLRIITSLVTAVLETVVAREGHVTYKSHIHTQCTLVRVGTYMHDSMPQRRPESTLL